MGLLRYTLVFGLGVVSGMIAPAGAAEVQDLYDARVPVIAQGESERHAAIRSAFAEVLVKVTGDQRAPSLSPLAATLDDPMKFVQQFRYRTLEAPRPEEADAGREYTQAIHVSFDPQAVNQLLQDAGVPVWGRTRPTTLLWVAVEDQGERYLVDADSGVELPKTILQAAERRGLPVLLPLLDLVDQRRIGFTDVWGNFEDAVLGASARYETGAVLVGRLYRTPAGGWSARWSLYHDGTGDHWRSEGAQQLEVVAAGIGGTADLLGQRYAQLLSTKDARALDIVVTEIADLDDYARTADYLRQLDPVSDVQIASVEPTQVRFRVSVRGDRDGLVRTIRFGDTLVPTGPDPGSAAPSEQPSGVQALTYRLLP